MCCIELSGPENSLLGGLIQITGPGDKMGQSFDSSKCLDGRCEGFAWIFHPNKFPNGVIGKVSFLWKPISVQSQTRTVWIWSHPGFYKEFLSVLTKVFSLEEKLQQSEDEEPAKKKLKFCDPILELKLAHKNIDADRIPKLHGRRFHEEEEEVTATLLKDTLNRFRLVGPLTRTILKNSLHLPKLVGQTGDENAAWWKNYSKASSLNEESFWKIFDQVFEFPDGLAFGLIVRDPRKVLPPKRGCALMPTKGELILF